MYWTTVLQRHSVLDYNVTGVSCVGLRCYRGMLYQIAVLLGHVVLDCRVTAACCIGLHFYCDMLCYCVAVLQGHAELDDRVTGACCIGLQCYRGMLYWTAVLQQHVVLDCTFIVTFCVTAVLQGHTVLDDGVKRRMQPARSRFARFDLDRQIASTFPAHWKVGPAPVFCASQPNFNPSKLSNLQFIPPICFFHVDFYPHSVLLIVFLFS